MKVRNNEWRFAPLFQFGTTDMGSAAYESALSTRVGVARDDIVSNNWSVGNVSSTLVRKNAHRLRILGTDFRAN